VEVPFVAENPDPHSSSSVQVVCPDGYDIAENVTSSDSDDSISLSCRRKQRRIWSGIDGNDDVIAEEPGHDTGSRVSDHDSDERDANCDFHNGDGDDVLSHDENRDHDFHRDVFESGLQQEVGDGELHSDEVSENPYEGETGAQGVQEKSDGCKAASPQSVEKDQLTNASSAACCCISGEDGSSNAGIDDRPVFSSDDVTSLHAERW